MEEWTNKMERENFFNEPEDQTPPTYYYSVTQFMIQIVSQLWTGTSYTTEYKLDLAQEIVDHKFNILKVEALASYLILSPLTTEQFFILTDQTRWADNIIAADPVLKNIDRFLTEIFSTWSANTDRII